MPDAFLLELVDGDRRDDVRDVVAALLVDLDRASPILRDRELASRLVTAAGRESDRGVAHNLVSAVGNVDLEATKLDDRVRDLGRARGEDVGDNLVARVVTNAESSPRAASVVAAWLAGPPSTFRRLVQVLAGSRANDPDAASFCAALLEAAKRDPSTERAVFDAVATGEGCTKAQRAAARSAVKGR